MWLRSEFAEDGQIEKNRPDEEKKKEKDVGEEGGNERKEIVEDGTIFAPSISSSIFPPTGAH